MSEGTKTEVVAAVETVVLFDRLTDAEDEGLVVTTHGATDPVAGDPPAAENWEVLPKVGFSRLELQTVSDLKGGGGVKTVGTLWVTGEGLADTADEADVLTEAVFWGGVAVSEVSLLEQIRGALFIADSVFVTGTVVKELKLEVE